MTVTCRTVASLASFLVAGLRRAHNNAVLGQASNMGRVWSIRTLTGASVRYMEVLTASEIVDAQDEKMGLLGRGETERLDHLAGIVVLLDDWVKVARTKPDVKQEVRHLNAFNVKKKESPRLTRLRVFVELSCLKHITRLA